MNIQMLKKLNKTTNNFLIVIKINKFLNLNMYGQIKNIQKMCFQPQFVN